ncbi:MAG: hypothetical protein ACO3EK_05310, partial [Alphaproteobacteria bacterium]
MIEDGDALPAPSSMERVMKDRAARDAVAFSLRSAPMPRPTGSPARASSWLQHVERCATTRPHERAPRHAQRQAGAPPRQGEESQRS